MNQAKEITETELLAHALYQLRIVLASAIGSQNDSPIEVRFAAHLAYALHNEALAMIEGKSFDTEAALGKIEAIDGILKTEDGSKFAHFLRTRKA
jgi:hypothetical protein